MFIINGRAIARQIREELKQKIAVFGVKPGLAVILVGEDPASKIYVSLKEKACAEVGVYFEKYIFPTMTPEETIIKTIEQLNNKTNIHGVLVQLPLPAGFDADKIIAAIDPKKDADGFGTRSKAEPVLGKAVWRLIAAAKEQKAKNKEQDRVLIVGKNNVFLQTMSSYLHSKQLDVKIVKSTLSNKLQAPSSKLQNYDIIVVAVGQPNFFKADDFKNNAIIIDIGTNRLTDGRVVGDVDFDSAKNKNIWLTPVPGGVGPVTVATLLENTYLLAVDSCK